MHSSLFKFALALNSALLFRKLLGPEFLLRISENFLCSILALTVETVLLLDALHMLIFFLGTLAYLESKLFLLIVRVFYNCISLII